MPNAFSPGFTLLEHWTPPSIATVPTFWRTSLYQFNWLTRFPWWIIFTIFCGWRALVLVELTLFHELSYVYDFPYHLLRCRSTLLRFDSPRLMVSSIIPKSSVHIITFAFVQWSCDRVRWVRFSGQLSLNLVIGCFFWQCQQNISWDRVQFLNVSERQEMHRLVNFFRFLFVFQKDTGTNLVDRTSHWNRFLQTGHIIQWHSLQKTPGFYTSDKKVNVTGVGNLRVGSLRQMIPHAPFSIPNLHV